MGQHGKPGTTMVQQRATRANTQHAQRAFERLEAAPGVLTMIFAALLEDPADLARTGAVCRFWRTTAASEVLWRQCCERWPLLAALKARRPAVSWRQLYAQRAGADRELLAAAASPDFGKPTPASTRSDYLVGIELKFGDNNVVPPMLVELDEAAGGPGGLADPQWPGPGKLVETTLATQPTLDGVVRDINPDENDGDAVEVVRHAQLNLYLVRKSDGKCMTLGHPEGMITDEVTPDGETPGDMELKTGGTVEGMSFTGFLLATFYIRTFRDPMDRLTCKPISILIYLYDQNEPGDTDNVLNVTDLLFHIEHPSCAALWK